jgi:hypothetical protein
MPEAALIESTFELVFVVLGAVVPGIIYGKSDVSKDKDERSVGPFKVRVHRVNHRLELGLRYGVWVCLICQHMNNHSNSVQGRALASGYTIRLGPFLYRHHGGSLRTVRGMSVAINARNAFFESTFFFGLVNTAMNVMDMR